MARKERIGIVQASRAHCSYWGCRNYGFPLGYPKYRGLVFGTPTRYHDADSLPYMDMDYRPLH